jgi:glutamine synthetase
MVASELEFFLFKTSYETAHASDYRELQPSYHLHGDNDILVSGFDEYLLGGIRRTMSAIGINLHVAQGEGAPGQHELNFSPASPLQMADRHVLYKHGVKACAHQAGHSATFLAKLYTDWAGSSCHFHISLYNTAGEPAFGIDELDPLGASFLAGLLTYSPELMVCHAPYANSYRRLQPGTFAPSNLTWGWDNRTCMVRAVGRGQRCRLEFRTPGADVNPYLSLAALLAAGLAGVVEGLEPPAPTTGDAYSDPHAPPLPRELGEAVRLFSESTLARNAFGDEVHRHLLGLAEHELDAGRRAVTDWDRRRGFEST